MPLNSTAGQALVNAVLPEELRNHERALDKKGMASLMKEVARKHPEQYREVLFRLGKLGHLTAYHTGSLSFGLEHMRTAVSARDMKRKLRQEIDQIYDHRSLSQKEKEQKIVELVSSYQAPLEKAVYDESLAEGNPLALQVLSGARGNKTNLRSLRGADLLYVDHKDQPVPIPILRSYSEGLTPADYYAGSFGARKGVIDVKQGVADSGFASKLLVQMSHRLVTTSLDHPEPPSRIRGLPVDLDDPDNEGALLAHDIGPFKRNTVLTPDVLHRLKQEGHKHLLVRSPTVGGPPDGGVYARDVGIREKGVISPVGDFVGIAAAQALCLAEGTLVTLADLTFKRIEEVAPGDLILAANSKGETASAKVNRRFLNGPRACLRYFWSNQEHSVLATSEHKVLRPDKTVRPFDQTSVVLLHTPQGPTPAALDEPLHQEPIILPTYDLEIDHPEHLYVLKGGLIVANSEPLTQSTLGSKHSGGVAGAKKSGPTGFKLLSCLGEGTLVRMADVPSKEIEKIKPGDRVIGANLEGGWFPVQVKNVFDNGQRPCRTFTFESMLGEESLTATDDHLVLAQAPCYKIDKTLADKGLKRFDEWEGGLKVSLGEIRTAHNLPHPLAPVGYRPVKAAKEPGSPGVRVELLYATPEVLLPTYDLEVDHPDHLFVLANGLVVSNSQIQVPKAFPSGASHSQEDGRVQAVFPAPQGGNYVQVNGHKHYVAPGFDVLVKPGDEVESGDVLSEGVPNPAEVVAHKGVGEGRAYFVQAFRDSFKRSGLQAHRRNIELVARGLIDHVRLTEEHGHYSPDDVVQYSRLERDWQPRDGAKEKAPNEAMGHYLEAPVLHYSIGTKIRPSVVKRLSQFGVKSVLVHQQPPPFEPEMVRGMENLTHDPDWMTRFLGPYVKKNFLKGVARGDISDEAGSSYVPSLARGADFNRLPPVKGFDPRSLGQL